MNFIEQIELYEPIDAQEIADKAAICMMIQNFPDTILLRNHPIAHLTASGFILNATYNKTLMIHHNIYQSWGWTGGHADGIEDLLQVALKEAQEETGITCIKPLSSEIASLDILPVFSHIKREKFINTHLHLSCAYLFVADDQEPLQHEPSENSGASWIPLKDINTYATEKHMLPIYQKLIKKAEIIYAKKHK